MNSLSFQNAYETVSSISYGILLQKLHLLKIREKILERKKNW